MTDWTPSIERLRELDNGEWLRVQDTYCGRLLAYANRRTGDLQASEDIVQETLLGAVRGINDFDPLFTFEQYLFGICRNRTIDYLREKATVAESVADGNSSARSATSEMGSMNLRITLIGPLTIDSISKGNAKRRADRGGIQPLPVRDTVLTDGQISSR